MKHATWTMLCLAAAHLVTNTGQAEAAKHVAGICRRGSIACLGNHASWVTSASFAGPFEGDNPEVLSAAKIDVGQ